MRPDGRQPHEVRPITVEPDFIRYPEGSVLWRAGDTVVLCNASLADTTAPFLRGSGEGWVTAEYAMLPRATDTRSDREVNKGRPSGRSQEIQRLIGRALRAAVRRDLMGERTLTVDCDVLQADGSTRTSSISGGWTALTIALARMYEQGLLASWPLAEQIAGVAVGLRKGEAIADLDYGEDYDCDVDLNLVFTGTGRLVEVQGTAEGAAFTRAELDAMLEVGWRGAGQVMAAQRAVVAPRLEALGLALP
ncbi:MAG: ribonuclease PH [Thermoanaerobaculales bacterium]|jgi:ribonuclease PH|nr:ribonuclease PH [Thermoanaerobaculales bacterium]